MDVTPQLLKEVEFREKFRGYDPDEVDDFLERVGIAFGQLQEKMRDGTDQIEAANARAARAEARARDSSDSDDMLRRTLVLAQRTADAAIKEAEETAASITAAAEAQAHQQYSAAEDRAAQLQAAAESDSRRVRDDADADTRQLREQADAEATEKVGTARTEALQIAATARTEADRLVTEAGDTSARMIADAEKAATQQAREKRELLLAEVGDLERRRDALAHDLNALETHTSLQRDRMAAVLQQLRSIVEEPAALGEMPLPQLTSISVADAAVAHAQRQSPQDAPRSGLQSVGDRAAIPLAAVAAAPPDPATGSEARVSNDEGGGRDVPASPAAAGADDASGTPVVDLIASEESDRASGSSVRAPSERVLTDVPAAAAAAAGLGQARPLPPVQAPPGSHSSSGLGTPLPVEEPGSGAPPWMGMAPPPPPPPPPTGAAAKESASAPGAVPPPPPAPSSAPVAEPAVSRQTTGDSFLDELRRAVGEDSDQVRREDPAIRFFEDRDPTDPALRFFEDGDDSRSRFRRR